jgi:threonine/homoserine/homoserine lactone efflux protein
MDAQLIAGSLALVLLTVSPGADMALVARVALGGGARAAFLTTLGICTGLPLHAAASALGISAILATSAEAFAVARTIGAAYLVWLGVQAWREAGDAGHAGVPADVGSGAALGDSRAFAQGFLSNALNPKVALFYLAFLPQFMRPGDAVLARSLLFAAIHAAMGIVWLTAYARAIERLSAVFRRSGVRRWLERTTGTVLVALGVRLAFERR